MKQIRAKLPLLISAVALLVTVFSHDAVADGNPRVRVQTSMGAFVIELDPERAPFSVANFLQYVKEGHYVGTIFHRVVGGFIVQGGGYTPQGELKPTRIGIPNESGNGMSNLRGTVGMARSSPPHSANSQFYVNLNDNPSLDPQPGRWGYAVFGKVVEGLPVADKIGDVSTGPSKLFPEDAPLKPVIIEKVELLPTS